jgi:hypothetical protein
VRGRFFNFAFLAAISASLSNTSWAASPPASCACKFVGVWSHSAGTTTVHADGTMTPNCPAHNCVATQTWTCDGDRFIFSNNSAPPGEFEGKLIDPNHVQGPTWSSARVSGGSCGSSGRKQPPASATETQSPANNSDACITIGQSHAGGRTYESNGWQTNYYVSVRPSLKPGCPKRPDFTYKEPDGKLSGPWEAPFKVQTVGSPAADIHAVSR